ncbi:MAG: hypothetical protein CFK49_11400 [Armatimonadetes bacterium JP3_11]|jgi:hypothetical protein|nr:MAG: hypothetical protein CFK49_11400 [Armatimonadetes bacterium JP3_11]RMH10656.1 MAG: hypothetical protein D6697_00500 [Armatimonadota bacterium]
MQGAEWVFRDAKLIEAGIYPDKGVTITEAHLEGLVRTFRAPVPILVEHRPSPLLLGWLVRVWRQGDALFGRLALFPEADMLLRRLRLRGLSVGLSRGVRRLLEVSVTASPRIPGAHLFHAAPEPQEVIRLERDELREWATEMSHQEMLESRIRELEAELRRREVREQVQQWSLRGQLPHALAPLAEAILLQGDAPVQFSGTTTTVAELFRQFVNSLSPQNLLAELAPMPETETPSFSADALEFLRRAFPDLNPAEILQQEVRERCQR